MATLFYEILGKKLQDMRERKNISREEMGKKLGITRQAVFNYEKGIREIDAVKLIKFCKICNYNANDLVKEMMNKI